MLNYLKLFFAFSLMFLLFIGCGKTEQQQQQQTPGDNKPAGEQQNQQQPAGDQTQKKVEGKNELGISEGLPADYPSDVPKPNNSKAIGFLSTQEGMVVTFESTDKPKDIFKAFEAELEKGGFTKSEDAQIKDEGGMCMWKKDKREVSIMLAWQKEKNVSSAVVTYK